MKNTRSWNLNSRSKGMFRNSLLKIIRPIACKICSINDPIGLNLLTRLHADFSRLHEHKLNIILMIWLNLLRSCSIESKNIRNYFLRCHFCNVNQKALLNDLRNSDDSVPAQNDDSLIKLLLYTNGLFQDNINQIMFMCTITFLKFHKNFLNSFSH